MSEILITENLDNEKDSLGNSLSLGKNSYNILDYGYSDYVKEYLEKYLDMLFYLFFN